jgi:hypothetical protein
MTPRKEPARWRKHRSQPQFDLWRGSDHLATVWLEGSTKVGKIHRGGVWRWTVLLSETGGDLQSGTAGGYVSAQDAAKKAATGK